MLFVGLGPRFRVTKRFLFKKNYFLISEMAYIAIFKYNQTESYTQDC